LKEVNLKKMCPQLGKSTWLIIGGNKHKLKINIYNNSNLKELKNSKMTWINGEPRFAIFR